MEIKDLARIGKVVKSLPKKSIEEAISVSADTFTKVISPIIETTAGLGRLIKVKFDNLVDVEKVYAIDTLMKAKEKIEKAKKNNNQEKVIPKATIIMDSIKNASNETNDELRNIWSNLIANELLTANVHPEFPRILRRLSAQDAQALSEITKNNASDIINASISVLLNSFSFSINYKNFSYEHLTRLGLIELEGRLWRLTILGEEFLKVVFEPI